MAGSRPAEKLLEPRDILWGALLALAAATLYLSFLTKAYVFEGLARAMPIELGRLGALFNGNYLLYGFVGSCFDGLLRALGFSGLAVVSLQIMDAFLGASGIFLYFLTLRLLGGPRPAAALWSAVLGLSLGYWSWSTDAQDYIFSTFLLGLNFFFLVAAARGRRVSPALLGALHALAALGHIVNMLFGFVGVWFLVSRHGRDWRRPLGQFAAASLGGVVSAYGAALLFIVRPTGAAEFFRWFLGSAATLQGGMNWHGSWPLSGLWSWARMTLNILVSRAPGFADPPAWRLAPACLWGARALLALIVLRLGLEARRLSGPGRTIALGCAVWLASYAAVFTSWEPHTMVYRVSDLIPIVTLLFLGVEMPGASRILRGASVLFAVLLGLGNFGAEIYPRSFAANNPRLARMEFIKAHTAEGDWIATGEADAGADELYIPYFAQRRAILLAPYRLRGAELSRRLDALLSEKQGVYASSRVLSDDFWKGALGPFSPKARAEDGKGFVLYRLSPRTSP